MCPHRQRLCISVIRVCLLQQCTRSINVQHTILYTYGPDPDMQPSCFWEARWLAVHEQEAVGISCRCHAMPWCWELHVVTCIPSHPGLHLSFIFLLSTRTHKCTSWTCATDLPNGGRRGGLITIQTKQAATGGRSWGFERLANSNIPYSLTILAATNNTCCMTQGSRHPTFAVEPISPPCKAWCVTRSSEKPTYMNEGHVTYTYVQHMWCMLNRWSQI